MRILRVAQNLYPEVPGGGTYHVHAMSRDQAAMGHDVTVLTVSGDKTLPREEERDGYTIVRQYPTIELLGNEISVDVARFLRHAEDFDVVHAHSHLYFSTNLTALARRLGNIPLAITNHGLYSQNAPEWFFDIYLRTVGQWIFNQSDIVFCYTSEDRRRVRDLGVDSRIEVISNGVDTERFTPDGAAAEMVDHDGAVVLFVGRLVDGKRPKDALRAVSRLPEDLNAKLYIVGDGPLRSELESEAENNCVEFLGQIPYQKMPEVYRAGDVLLLTSQAEGLPRTILEAMASGIPVVVSALEQIKPVVGDAGITVPVGDIDGFTAGVEEALEGTISNPQTCVMEQYNWSDTVKQTTEALKTLI